jgi:serine/threonine-protein kinase
MSAERDTTSNNASADALEKTFVPSQTAPVGSKGATGRAQDAAPDLDATFVPDGTSANAQQRMTNSAEAAGEKAVAANSAPAKKSGTSQLGKYKLVKKLGQGGMGEVYLGEDTSLGRKAAIKVLSKPLAGNEDFVKRFYKEARAMARVNHDNAVSVFDVGQERGIHYVAMEFVDGKSMQKWMDTLGKLSVGDALYVTLRCAEALQFAHSEHLIHRDIKPDNIMLTSKGKVKVADFGLAKATDEDLSMTASGTGLGTPFYMAPEQARNAKHVDGRADVYALGITLYYFVTGKLPFGGNSALEVITAKEKGRYDSPRKLNPQVSDRLDLMIAKMIEKEPDRRFKDCAEVISMLSGLGLENPTLSFIEAPGRAGQSASAGAAPVTRPVQKPVAQAPRPAPAKRPAAAAVPKTSAEDAEAQVRRSRENADVAANTWLVQFKSAQGKETIGKLTTVQILTALKTGSLSNKAKLKKKTADTFMPIGFFPEFEKAIEGLNIKEKAELKAVGMKAEFAKIGRQYDRRAWTRWFSGLVSGTAGLIKLVIWLGMIFGGLFALVVFRSQAWDAFANFYNSFQKN